MHNMGEYKLMTLLPGRQSNWLEHPYRVLFLSPIRVSEKYHLLIEASGQIGETSQSRFSQKNTKLDVKPLSNGM